MGSEAPKHSYQSSLLWIEVQITWELYKLLNSMDQISTPTKIVSSQTLFEAYSLHISSISSQKILSFSYRLSSFYHLFWNEMLAHFHLESTPLDTQNCCTILMELPFPLNSQSTATNAQRGEAWATVQLCYFRYEGTELSGRKNRTSVGRKNKPTNKQRWCVYSLMSPF